MIKKSKLRYQNFNICQLLDKGKMKLQYTDNYKASIKKYSENHSKKKDETEGKSKKGIIKNINKNLLSSMLVLTLITTPLVGCVQKEVGIKYSKANKYNGKTIDNIDYELLKECHFLVIKNEDNDNTEFYICDDVYHFPKNFPSYCTYNDIFNKHELFNELNEEKEIIVFREKINNYLLDYSMVKDNYTEKEVEFLLEQLKKDYFKQNNKQLVKEK